MDRTLKQELGTLKFMTVAVTLTASLTTMTAECSMPLHGLGTTSAEQWIGTHAVFWFSSVLSFSLENQPGSQL